MPGRGRSRGPVAWGGAGQRGTSRAQAAAGRGRAAPPPADQPERRFAEACAQIKAASQKHTAQYELSDSEEEEVVDDDTRDQIIGKLCRQLSGKEALGNTSEYVQRALNADASTCLICIGSVKRADAVWCCSGCYVGFHLSCIQKWARDSISQQQLRLDEGDARHALLDWHCPNCRCSYPRADIPSRYVCYCGKVADPPLDPWLLPHACDQRCDRPLRPDCGHACLLKCHPGPCPPCPMTVKTRCYCGASGPDARRCGNKAWACRKACNKLLDCTTHRCLEQCHRGECGTCGKTSRQPCNCGSHAQLRPCATPRWQCDTVCGRPLSCGNHTCAVVCHAAPCPPCPRAELRHCPCGRTSSQAPCDQEVATCGDTCDKWLDCGAHRCATRCHTGNCGRLRVKRCRCGRKEKEMVCGKEFTCEVKCKQLKDCGKHTCNRKCCTGQCPPCEQTCGKTLPCRQHKCCSPCHTGPCYPCPLTAVVACPCGHSRLTVPCGRERSTRPPRCRRPCAAPPDCHHAARQPHTCHAGTCPPCTLTCGRPLQCCRGHTCPQACHQQVTRRLASQKRAATPWETQQEQLVTVTLPCPPCQASVSVPCVGGHAEYPMPCERARSEPCGRQCGRLLACGNHHCQQSCHPVEQAADSTQAGLTCDTCQLACWRPRPVGCQHTCPRGCHVGECAPCREHRRLRCHCGVSLLHVRCHELTEAGDQGTAGLLSCGNTCPKLLPCGHRCALNCHAGDCHLPTEGCQARVRQRCRCGRLSRTVVCRDLGPDLRLDCDQTCADTQRTLQLEREIQENAAAEQEAARRQREVEQLERKLGGGRRRERKRREVAAVDQHGGAARWVAAVAAVVVLVAAAYLVYQ